MPALSTAVPASALAIAIAVATALVGSACTAPGQPRNYYITPTEMLEVYGVYHLSNGETMRILREQRRYWVESPGNGRKEIRPVAWMVFESLDRDLRLEFTPQAFATLVNVTRPARGGA